MKRAKQAVFRAAVVVAALCVAAHARAEPSASERAIAQTAFDEGRALFEHGEVARACDKFALSRKLDPKIGSVMNYAICLERIGRTASAYAEFVEAQSLARRANRLAVVRDAETRAQALAPRLSRIKLRVHASVAELRIDGETLDRAAWAVDVPLDPGAHVVRAAAPGHKPLEFAIAATEGSVTPVEVGALAAESSAAPPLATPTPALQASTAPSSRRTVGVVLGAAGIAVAGAGLAFGAVAISRRSAAEDACLAGDCTRGEGLNRDARAFAWTSDIAVGAGVIAAGVGVILWVTAPRASAAWAFPSPHGLAFHF